MPSRPPGSSAQKQSAKPTKAQLERILSSATFQRVDRLKRFLRFVVSKQIEGRGDELKEYVVGIQVFGKESSFDPRTDPIVRVQARRLRARLDRYYRTEGRHDELIIDLPKGGYAPVIRAHDARRQSASVSHNTVAVLPFADNSSEGNLRFFCNGLRQEIIHGLTLFRTLRVIATESREAFGDLRDLGATLEVAALLIGSVRPAGDQLRVTVQMIDTASGSYVWSEAVELPVAEAPAAPERIAQAIVDKLRPQFLESGSSQWSSPATQNLAAHNLYLQGRYHLNQRTEEGLQKALEFFEKAIVEDAHYALAHSGLSDAWRLLTHYGVLPPSEVSAKAAASAATAVVLDGHSAEAHTSLAHVKATQDWDWPGAEREFQRAIELNPRYPTAHHWYAMSCLVPMGRLGEAAERMAIAQSLDPISSIIARDVAVIHLYLRGLDAALEQCDHAIELNPHFSPAYLTLGLIQERREDYDESIAAFQRAVHLSPDTPRMHAGLARALARSGRQTEARRILGTLEERARKRYVSPIEFASVHLALRDVEAALTCLDRAVADRRFEVLALNVDPRFDVLRKEPRFTKLVRQVGLA
jgi:TolB-like protein/Flp pilus assembly protein TadD